MERNTACCPCAGRRGREVLHREPCVKRGKGESEGEGGEGSGGVCEIGSVLAGEGGWKWVMVRG